MENQLRDEFQRLRKENPQKLAEIIQSMSDAEAEAILYDYTLWAHDTQLKVIESRFPVTLLCGGRGLGKNWTMSNIVKKYIDQGVKQIGLIGPTAADTRDTIILGESGILNAFPEKDRPVYEPSKRRVFWPDKNAQAVAFCATEDTEILTPEGWKTYDQISIGDLVRTYNTETGKAEWQPAEAVNVFDVEDEIIIHTSMNMHSSRVTMNHKWPAMDKTSKKVFWRDSILDFSTKDGVITAAPSAELPTEKAYSDSYVALIAWFTTEGCVQFLNERQVLDSCADPDEYFRVVRDRMDYLGWKPAHLAERCGISNSTARWYLYQSPPTDSTIRENIAYGLGLAESTLNKYFEPKYRRMVGSITQNYDNHYDEIMTRLENVFGSESKSLRDVRKPAWKQENTGRECGRFNLNDEAVRVLLDVCVGGTDKIVPIDFINKLTEDQLYIFSDAFIKADGSNRGEGSVITQKIPERLDSLEYANILLGRTVRRSVRYHTLNTRNFPRLVKPNYKNTKRVVTDSPELMVTSGIRANASYPVNMMTKGKEDPRKVEYYTGKVWCPTTKNSTWLARHEGTVFYTGNSAEEPERIRGANNELLIMDEIGSWKDKDTYDQAMLTLRIGISRAFISSTPRNNEIFRYLHANRHDPENNPKGFVNWIQGSTYENLHNLSDAFRNQIITNYEGTRLGQQELMGELLLDSDEALWNSEMIADAREYAHNIPPAKSCVIGVDPAVSTKKKSDKTGIVLAIMGVDDVAYVLEDHTGKYSPEGWARVAIELFKEWQQKCPTTIVVERNQGGEMVRNTLERVERWLPIDDIFSSQDKLSRAQPIALMYEKGRVKHAPGLVDLEQELCSYDGKGRSPDRMDAMVFALTKLMPVNRSITKSRELLM